jgi:hypothetical protein
MHYFLKKQPIALPLNSEKEPLDAQFGAQTPVPLSPLASRQSKLKKILIILVPLLFIGVLGLITRSRLHKKNSHRHNPHIIWPGPHGHFRQRHYDHRLRQLLYQRPPNLYEVRHICVYANAHVHIQYCR